MQRESLRQYRERVRRLLEDFDERVDRKRRYRGFLPNYLRNYMLTYLGDKGTAKYGRREHFEMTNRLKAADKDYALAILYAGKVESNRLDEKLKETVPRMARFKDDQRRQEIGEALKPVLRLVENDFNAVLAKYHAYVPWRAHISFDYHVPEPNVELLRRRLRRRWKRMPHSSIQVKFSESKPS
jgi:hypothetical protein